VREVCNSFGHGQMPAEAVLLSAPWTAQPDDTSIGYVQLHYELGGTWMLPGDPSICHAGEE